MDQVYIPQKDYKVLVRCMTYNQSRYIEDALNGFAMQQTDFPFVCLVMDDCSTDGEQDVIKAWMEHECDMEKADNLEIEKSFITVVPHKSNLNCQFAFYFLKQNLYRKDGKAPLISPWRKQCEYEAMCEGDDFWIHPKKLQMQVNALDNNFDVCACYTRANVYDQTQNKEIGQLGEAYKEFHDLFIENRIPTLTSMYRIQHYHRYYEEVSPMKRGWLMGDYPMWLWMALNSTILYLDEITSVYRIVPESAHHSRDIDKVLRFVHSTYEIRTFFIENYDLPDLYAEDAKNSLAKDCAYCYGASDRSMFVKYFKSISNKSLKDYFKLFLAFFNLYPRN